MRKAERDKELREKFLLSVLALQQTGGGEFARKSHSKISKKKKKENPGKRARRDLNKKNSGHGLRN